MKPKTPGPSSLGNNLDLIVLNSPRPGLPARNQQDIYILTGTRYLDLKPKVAVGDIVAEISPDKRCTKQTFTLSRSC